jgi:hypothetical protein
MIKYNNINQKFLHTARMEQHCIPALPKRFVMCRHFGSHKTLMPPNSDTEVNVTLCTGIDIGVYS